MMRSRRSCASSSDRHHERGLTLMEVIVTIALMAILAGTMATLVGAAVRSKLIIAVRTADTETARQTLEWMTERLRNAGFNLKPGDQTDLRCKDIVVAQDASLRPTAARVYVSGEILNSNTTAGDEVITLGYLMGSDPGTGKTVIMEFRQGCAPGSAATTTPLSDPRVSVTAFQLTYFDRTGTEVTNLTSTSEIRRIRSMRITLTVQWSQGSSGVQTQTWRRDVMLRNPEPNLNNWENPDESV